MGNLQKRSGCASVYLNQTQAGKKVKKKYMPSILDEWPLPQGDYVKLLQVPGLDHEALFQLQSWASGTVIWAD